MTVFAEQNPIITCPVCRKTFREGGIRCLVLHTPGTCCHFGDVEYPSLPYTGNKLSDIEGDL